MHLSLRSLVSGQAQHGLTSPHDLELDGFVDESFDEHLSLIGSVMRDGNQKSTNSANKKIEKIEYL